MWIIAGFALLAAETLTPGLLYLAFLGVSAFFVGLLAWLIPGLELWLEILFFCVVMVVLAAFRRKILEKLNMRPPDIAVDELTQETAVALEDIAPGARGKAEMRGTAWNARNTSAEAIKSGERCRVAKVDGLVIEITR
jgi:membrane protein implicated in regulation of membrane protease activity